ncbi:MAG: anti-sigma factor family protein [Chloroflexota bacterium]
MHLTERQLNEYLDNATDERARIQTHLDSCDDCAARLATLQTLFAELDSLPELAFTSPLAARVLLDLKRTPRLPRWLTLTSLLQTAAAVVAIIVAAPLVLDYLPTVQAPTWTDTLAQIQIQWLTWIDALAAIQAPALPELPALGISSLSASLVFLAALAMWLFGNRALLKNHA